jgi:MEMO1 family protein
MSRVRMAAVAGRFYPADPVALAQLVDGLVTSVPSGDAIRAWAYVVPHAGYQYSGRTAAHAYARLRGQRPERIVLIGPAHYARLRGCAVPVAPFWRTPLGDVPIDLDGAHRLVAAGLAIADDEPFAPEHSLEVQLPFLQRVAVAPVLPIAAGPSTVEDVAAVLVEAAGTDSVVLCSTDLSHYQTEAVAREQDACTAEAVMALAPERIGVRDACGVFALRGLLFWARQAGLRPHALHLSTSADTTHDTSRVVGYGAFSFEK